MTFIARDQSAKVLQPGEEAFDLPAAAVAAELSAILCLAPAVAVGRDQFDVTLRRQTGVQAIRIVGLVTNQSDRRFAEELGVEGLLDKRDFAGACTCDSNGERKTTAVCDCHDLGPLAFAGGADAEAPFFAPA